MDSDIADCLNRNSTDTLASHTSIIIFHSPSVANHPIHFVYMYGLKPFIFIALPIAASAVTHQDEHRLIRGGVPQIGRLQHLINVDEQVNNRPSAKSWDDASLQTVLSATGAVGEKEFQAHCFYQPVSHFIPETDDPFYRDAVNQTFCQRYWFDLEYYQPGGPVFVLDGGETSGANRLDFLRTGIIQRLAKEYNGIPVVLEHRYYGYSFPLGPKSNLSTDSLRFLNNEEALEDSAEFIRNVQFDGIHEDLTGGKGKKTKWIYYGGSYAGARAAHMRKLYPNEVFGAIASSAVTHAQVYYPEYMDAIRVWGPPECIGHIETVVQAVDTTLDRASSSKKAARRAQHLKAQFGLEDLEDDDFVSVLSEPLGYWQARNWDPELGSLKFYEFCDALKNVSLGSTEVVKEVLTVDELIANYATFIKKEIQSCPEKDDTASVQTGKKKKLDVVQCFGTHDDAKFQDVSRMQTWRAWLFQVCTQWGYFQGAPLEGPRIISHRINLNYTSKICRQAFPAGELMTVPEWPDVSVVNDLGDFDLSEDRLAIIDGDSDPWRPATPQSDYAKKREDTVIRPVKLIPDAVHHYDENGLANPAFEPERIQKVHKEMIDFVGEWLKSDD